MLKFCAFTLFALLICGCQTYAQKVTNDCSKIEYGDNDQIIPEGFVLSKIKGKTIIKLKDSGESPFVMGCVALFEEQTKGLVKSITPNERGEFKFKNIPDGKYRLVVKAFYNAFCLANLSVEINKKVGANKEIQVNMVGQGTDNCSYGVLQ